MSYMFIDKKKCLACSLFDIKIVTHTIYQKKFVTYTRFAMLYDFYICWLKFLGPCDEEDKGASKTKGWVVLPGCKFGA